jgi:hypothetical protein
MIPLIILAIVVFSATAWSPVFALVIALPLFLLFLAYVATRRRADEGGAEATAGESAEAPQGERAPGRAGIWGEQERGESNA